MLISENGKFTAVISNIYRIVREWGGLTKYDLSLIIITVLPMRFVLIARNNSVPRSNIF